MILTAPLSATYEDNSSSPKVTVVSRDTTNDQLSNTCNFLYEVPEGFYYDSLLVEKQQVLFMLLEKGKKVTNSLMLLGEFTEHTDSIKTTEEYNRRELNFLKKYRVFPQITFLTLENESTFKYEFSYQKWIASPYLYKKLIRFTLPDGYYTISIHGQSEEALEDNSFYELLESLNFECSVLHPTE